MEQITATKEKRKTMKYGKKNVPSRLVYLKQISSVVKGQVTMYLSFQHVNNKSTEKQQEG